MTALVDRITAVVDDHWPLSGGNRCDCGWSTFEHEGGHARHVAERIAAELQLTEETERISLLDMPYSRHRWVSDWTAVEETR